MRLYQSDVRRLLRKLTKADLALADDLAQDTFVKAYKSIKRFRGDASFKTWIFRIAYNVYRDAYRSQQRKPEDCLESVPEEAQDVDYTSDMKRRAINDAMALLNNDQRMAIYLCMQQEMTHQEASDVMGVPLGTLKSHIKRGKQKLQDILAEWRASENYVKN